MTEDLTSTIRDGPDLDAQSFAPLQWAVRGLIPASGLTVLAGRPKAGKSWLSLDVALAVADGQPTLGTIPTAYGSVLYLAFEDTARRLQSRGRRLLGDRPFPGTFHWTTDLPADPSELLPAVRAWAESRDDARMVILDTLGKLRRGGSYRKDYDLGSDLKALADHHGFGFVVVHHERKATSRDWMDRVTGSVGLPGAADNIILVSRERGTEDGQLCATGRDISEHVYLARFDAGRWEITGTVEDESNLGERSDAILALLDRDPMRTWRADAIAAQVPEIPRMQVGVYLRRLHEAGRITRVSRGVYASVRSVKAVTSGGIDDG